MSHAFGNDPAKVERYKKFWSREPVDRPLIGFSLKSWFSILEFSATKKWEIGAPLTPGAILPEEFVSDQEQLLREGETIEDDILRGASPLQGLRWFPAFLGCDVRILGESVSARDRCLSWDEIGALAIDYEGPWFQKYIEFTRVLVDRARGRYPVSHGTLLGPSDVGAVLRGHEQMVYDCYDSPRKVGALLSKIGTWFCNILEEQRKNVPLFHGGYYDAQYQLWAPEPIARLQEDNMFLFSPELYRRFLQPVDRQMAAKFPCSFMHLHSTSMYLLDAILEVEEIRACQLNIEPFNIEFKDMIEYFKMVQKADRSLLIRGSISPDELKVLLNELDPTGLYLYIMVDDLRQAEGLGKLVS